MRRTADRVEGDVQAYRDERAIDRVWATDAALLCCIGPDPGAERIVRATARLAVQLDVTWQAVYVETPRLQRRVSAERERILRIVALAQQLGASVAVLSGNDVADALADYARQHNIARMVLGRSRARGVLARLGLAESMPDRIARAVPEIDLVVVGGGARCAARRARRDGIVDAALRTARARGPEATTGRVRYSRRSASRP